MSAARRTTVEDPQSSDAGTARIAATCLYVIAVNAVLIQTIVDETSSLKTVVRVAVLGLAVLALFLKRVHVPRWLSFTVLLSAVLLLVGGNPDQLSYIFVLLLVPLLGQVDTRRMDKLFVLAALLSLALIFLLLWSGLTQNEVRDFRNRSTFGTASVPFFMNVVYGAGAMLILYCRKYRPRGGLAASVAYMTLATYFFTATDARGGYYALWVFVALLFVIPPLSSSAVFRTAIAVLPAGFLAFAFFIASQAGNADLNRLLSSRPYQYRAFLDRIDLWDFFISTSVKQFDALATRSTYNGFVTQGSFVDSSYLHLAAGGGVVLTAVFLIAYASAVRELFRRKLYGEIAVLTATATYFNTESLIVRIENVFVIYVWYLIVKYAARSRDSKGNPNSAWPQTRRGQHRPTTNERNARRAQSTSARTGTP